MSVRSYWDTPLRRGHGLVMAAMLVFPTTSFAQGTAASTPAPATAGSAAPSDSAMVNLVRLLIEQGVVSREKGNALMAQAEAEAAKARAAAPTIQQAQTSLPAPANGAIRVPYVPESVRAQIREELKTDVLAQARAEGWASPGERAPDWLRRIKLTGDVRVRSLSTLYSKANSNLIPDFARINQIGPIPIFERDTFIPLLNSRLDRASRLQVRARLGIEVNVSDGIEAGITAATGDNNGPISTNQSLGGGFGKRDLWLDQAYLRLKPFDWAKVELGRFPNPFLSSELLFDEDLRFDGVAATIDSGDRFGDGLHVVARGGAFPLDFGDANFPQNDVTKRGASERFLFSGQLETTAKITDDVSVTLAAAYHSYNNLQANLSEPCFLYRVQTEFRSGVICSTDNQRATFLRKGNTVVPIRDIVLDVPAPALNEVRVSPQFVGLAFDYDILDLNMRVRFPVSKTLGVTLAGNYLRNLSLKRGDLCRNGPVNSASYPPLNNVGADGDGNICSQTNPSSFVGGNQGYLGNLTIGHSALGKRGQWQASLGYRYLESDAVLDAYTDSIFHLGGTNAKGYVIGAKGTLFDGLIVGVRWQSANEISGDPFSIDVLQADIQVSF